MAFCNSYTAFVEAELEENLGMIEEVNDYMQVSHSHTITSLRFLKSLRKINGRRLHDGRLVDCELSLYGLDSIFTRNTMWVLNQCAMLMYSLNFVAYLECIHDIVKTGKCWKFRSWSEAVTVSY